MNKINLNWKYWLLALGVVAVCACSKDMELAQMANKQEYQEGTRTANWYTKEVVLEDIGQLEAKLTEAMNGEPLDTLEKLVISGPMAVEDFNYLDDNLSGLCALDLENISIIGNGWYGGNYSYEQLKNDTICRYMFAGWSALEEIILPRNLKGIENHAFYNCSSLQSVVIYEGVKSIPERTFEYCRSLLSVILPSSLEVIDNHAFHDCDSLKAVTIPDKVKYLGNGAFDYCDSLSLVVISSASELDSIGNGVFAHTHLKSITIPDRVRYMGNDVFMGCRSLLSVNLPSNIESIGSYAFRDCASLESIFIPDKVKYIGYEAFRYCSNLETVEFDENSVLDSIASSAFENCTKLTSIVIPENVKIIDTYTFRGCNLLSSAGLPSSLEEIRGYAFSGCAFTSVELPSTLKQLHGCSFEYCRSLTSIHIPEGVEHIGGHTFYDCDGLTELTIPESVTSIEGGFANYCDNIQAIFWKAPIDVPYCYGTNDSFLYVDTDQEITIDGSWNNVILNGVAQSTITIQENADSEFRILKEFTAPEVVYTRYFGDETVPGGSSGWQTIVLPFTPDSISHESKGLIAPFGSDVAGAKPFWLRELTNDGFADATTMSADKAYIIAMPNHSDYLNEYCLNGTITFKGKNVTLEVTPDELEGSVGPDFEFYPTYSKVKKTLRVYALQSQWGTYNDMWYNKNFFIRSSSDIYPFNAYVTALGGGRSSRTEFDLDTRSSATRGVPYKPNTTGVPQIGDM